MPHGISGLLIAAILAAAMSNLSAALNSLASTSVIDFYARLFPKSDDRRRVWVSRWLTIFWGVVLFALAILSRGGGRVVEVGLAIASVAYGGLLGVFLLGTLTRRATETGAIVGMVVGLVTNVLIWQGARFGLPVPAIAFTWYVPIGSILTFIVGYAVSLTGSAHHFTRIEPSSGLDRLAESVFAGRLRDKNVSRMSTTTISSKTHELARALNVRHATAIVVGTIIGSGIFLVPQEMTQAVGSAKLVYLAWIVGGILSLFGALTYAELGAMKPDAGGEYVYVRDAYGPLPGFLYMWTWFILAKPASIATVTIGIMRVLGSFHVFAFLPHTAFHLFALPVTFAQLGAILATILISGLNYIGVRRAGDFQLFFTWLKVLMIVGTAIIAFTYTRGAGWHNFTTSFAGAKGGFAGFMIALVAALWAYDGWNDLNMVAGEVAEPQRALPIALILGVAIVGVLYMLTNAAVQYVLPAETVARSSSPSALATTVAIGSAGGLIVAAGMALSMLVTLNGTIMSGARVPFAAARDGYFFRAIADVHPRFRTPGVSIIVQALVAIALLLLVGKFQALFSLAIFAEWLFYMIAASTVFVFRKTEPDTVRPYRTWGYPIVPAVFILCSAVLLYYTFTQNLRNSVAGTLIILCGVPLFWWFARARARD